MMRMNGDDDDDDDRKAETQRTGRKGATRSGACGSM